MERLEFLQKIGFLTAMGSVGINLLSCSDDDDNGLELTRQIQVDLTQTPFDLLGTEGEWVLHPDVNVLLVNVNSEIRAFSSVCPHSQCTRNWDYSPGVFTCNCHNSKFDATGAFLSGPANANLREIRVQVEENILTIG